MKSELVLGKKGSLSLLHFFDMSQNYFDGVFSFRGKDFEAKLESNTSFKERNKLYDIIEELYLLL